MRLRKEAFDLQTVLLIPVACLVDRSRLLHFQLQELLDTVLDDLPALLHSSSEGL
jgi:hypothetical protein